MVKFLMVAAGGSMGALCRHLLSITALRYIGGRFPAGTLMVNMIGCFLIGVVFALIDRTDIMTHSARLLFMTGFLGALTTFSTYALEVVRSVQSGAYAVAATHFIVNNLGGMTLVLAGIWVVGAVIEKG